VRQWRCVTSGIVTSVSVMMNGCSAVSALAYATGHKVSVGVHFNLTEGVPLAAPEAVPSLLAPAACGDGAGTGDRVEMRGKNGFWDAVERGDVVDEEVRRLCWPSSCRVCTRQ
jgi:hypothetical protein